MKSASLRHLLLLSGRAISDAVPDTAAAIAEIAATLSVSREGRSDFRLVYERGDEKFERAVPASRFDFYRRGDVAALNEKRPAGLDLRAHNWRAAHTTWAELLDRADLTALDTPPALRVVPPVLPAERDRLQLAADAAGVAVPVVVALATRRLAPLLVGSVAAGVSLADASGGRRFAGLAAAASSAIGRSADTAGIVASAASVLAALDLRSAPDVVRSVALPGVGAAAAGASSPGFAGAVLVGTLSDALAGGIGRRDPALLRSVGARAVGVLGGTIAARSRAGVAARAGGPAFAVVPAALVAETAVRVMEGSRDRLAPVVQPLGIALAAAWRRDRRLALALGVGVLAASAAARIVASQAAKAPAPEMPVAAPGTPVSLRRRGDQQAGAS